MVLDGAVSGADRQFFEFENQIVPCGNVVLAPYVAYIARQPGDEQGGDEIHGVRDRPAAPFVLPALHFARMRNAERPRGAHVVHKAKRVARRKVGSLGVSIVDEAQIDHELLPIGGLPFLPVALEPGQDVVDRHQIHNRIDHAAQLKPVECVDIGHHHPTAVDAQHEADIANIHRVAELEGALGAGVRQADLWNDLLNPVCDVEVRRLIRQVIG